MISLILGLGNIGEIYAGTRHNIGFECLDLLIEKLKAVSASKTDFSHIVELSLGSREIWLGYPSEMMNQSGLAAGELLELLDLTADNMLVVVDDFNLPLGSIRFRKSGSDGGHNGLASIINQLGTSDFSRLRLGIRPADEIEDSVQFVLGRFQPDEQKEVKRMLARSIEALIFALRHRFDETMSQFNENPALPDNL